MQKIAIEILDILHEAGYESYIVGGYVRDHLLGNKNSDIDFCTNATPKQIGELFKSITFPGEKYGTSLVVYKGSKFEITTYRKELHYLKNRTPETIEYINHIEEDIIRRDFTINAICMDRFGNIFDPLNGQSDLNNKLIRTINDPDTKINNDSLRILRAVRFATTLDFHLDAKLEMAIIKYRDNLHNISYEVKKQEIDKILVSPNKAKGISLLKKLLLDSALDIVIPEHIVDTDLLGMYAQLNMDDYYPLTKHEKVSVDEIKRLVAKGIVTKWDILNSGIYLVKIVAQILAVNLTLIDQMYQEMPIYAIDEVHITGEEITDVLNIQPGPIVKIIKTDVIYQVVYGRLKNNKKVIKNYILKNQSKWYNNDR